MTLLKRILGFGALPFLSLVAPFLVLPLLSRTGGQAGWASFGIGQSVGSLIAVFASLGWTLIGPSRVANATTEEQAYVYRVSLRTRGAALAVGLPIAVVAAAALATEQKTFASTVALSTCLGALSPSWFAVGVGRPRLIGQFELVPRFIGVLGGGCALLASGILILYPTCIALSTVIGVALLSRSVLKPTDKKSAMRKPFLAEIRELLSPTTAVAAGAAYSTTPLIIVGATALTSDVASFSSADRLYRVGLMFISSTANAFQQWTLSDRRRGTGGPLLYNRLAFAGIALVSLGLVGGVVFSLAVPPVTALLFGNDVRASEGTSVAYGLAFFAVCTNTFLGSLILVPQGGAHFVSVSTIAGAAFGVVAMVLLSHTYGGDGGAFGFALSEVVVTVAQLVAVLHIRRRRGNHDHIR